MKHRDPAETYSMCWTPLSARRETLKRFDEVTDFGEYLWELCGQDPRVGGMDLLIQGLERRIPQDVIRKGWEAKRIATDAAGNRHVTFGGGRGGDRPPGASEQASPLRHSVLEADLPRRSRAGELRGRQAGRDQRHQLHRDDQGRALLSRAFLGA